MGQDAFPHAFQQQMHGLALGLDAVGVGRGPKAAEHVAQLEDGVGVVGVEVHGHGYGNIIADLLAHLAQQVFLAAADAFHLHGAVEEQPYAVQPLGGQAAHNAVHQTEIILPGHGAAGQGVGIDRGNDLGPRCLEDVDDVDLFIHVRTACKVEVLFKGRNGAQRVAFTLQRTNCNFHNYLLFLVMNASKVTTASSTTPRIMVL